MHGEGGCAAHPRRRLRPRCEMSAKSALTLGSSTAAVRARIAGPKRSLRPVSGLQARGAPL